MAKKDCFSYWLNGHMVKDDCFSHWLNGRMVKNDCCFLLVECGVFTNNSLEWFFFWLSAAFLLTLVRDGFFLVESGVFTTYSSGLFLMG